MSNQFTMNNDCGLIVTTAAKYITSNIKNYCNKFPSLNLLPTIEKLMKDDRISTTPVILFLKNLLKHSKHKVSAKEKWDSMNHTCHTYHTYQILFMESGRVKFWPWNISCYVLDCIVLQTRKKLAQIANRLGRIITYDKIIKVETA